MKIQDIKKYCHLGRIKRLTSRNIENMSEIYSLIVMFDVDNEKLLIAASVRDGYVVELLVDNQNLTISDIDKFYEQYNLKRESHPDIELRKYR